MNAAVTQLRPEEMGGGIGEMKGDLLKSTDLENCCSVKNSISDPVITLNYNKREFVSNNASLRHM